MQSPINFIVKPKNDNRYNNTLEFADGSSMIVNTSTEDHLHVNREAIVLSVPLNYKGEIEPGDTLLIHHNVFKKYYGMSGFLRNATEHLWGNTFFVSPDSFFMYKKDGEWRPYDRYCFIRPIKDEGKGMFSNKGGEIPLVGEMVYPNEYLLSMGIKKGDRVCHIPQVEYEFMVDGEKLYRMYDHHITIKL